MTAGLAAGARPREELFLSDWATEVRSPGAIFVGHKGASGIHSASVILNDIWACCRRRARRRGSLVLTALPPSPWHLSLLATRGHLVFTLRVSS